MTYNSSTTSIKNWAEDDRPREKFILKGRNALSDAELLAVQLGSGSRNESAVELAKRILFSVDGSLNKLAKMSVEELTEFKGVGDAKAINILTALEIGRRRALDVDATDNVIRSSKDVYNMLQSMLVDLPHEEFWCLYLKQNNAVVKKELISKGGMSATVVDVRLVVRKALLQSATGIILAHNHPSGSLKPSHQDINITKSISKASELFDIKVLDHIIVGNYKYFSFADEGIL
ncbi:MAG: DNA repair protein RadC [Ichthyobacteriaceae bacterium]|nr:DNA repair protein RadC [Ichthyobacteriaceae bacterium]